MKKIILILLISLTLINLACAKLSEEQFNEAVSKVLKKVPNCQDIQGIKDFIISQDCEPQVIQSSITFSCGDNINHTYECRFGIHYLDGEVISILSSKTEYNNVQTTGDNSPIIAGNGNQIQINYTSVVKDNFWNIFWWPILTGLIVSFLSYLLTFKNTKFKWKLIIFLCSLIVLSIFSYLIYYFYFL